LVGHLKNKYLVKVEGFTLRPVVIPHGYKIGKEALKKGSTTRNCYYDTPYARKTVDKMKDVVVRHGHYVYDVTATDEYEKVKTKSKIYEKPDSSNVVYSPAFVEAYRGLNSVKGMMDTRYHKISSLQSHALRIKREDDNTRILRPQYGKHNKCPYKECVVCKHESKFWCSLSKAKSETYYGVATDTKSKILTPEERLTATYKDKFNHTKYIKSKLQSNHQKSKNLSVLKCGHTTRTPHKDFITGVAMRELVDLIDNDTVSMLSYEQRQVYGLAKHGHQLQLPIENLNYSASRFYDLRRKLQLQEYITTIDLRSETSSLPKDEPPPPYSISYDEKKRIAEIACKRMITRARTSNRRRDGVGTNYDHSQVKLSDIDRSDECILLQKLAGSVMTYDEIRAHLNDISLHIITILSRFVPKDDIDYKLENWELGTNTTEFPALYDLDEYYLSVEDKTEDMKAVMEMLNS